MDEIVRANFVIRKHTPVSDELKGYPGAWGVFRADDDFLEFETPQYFNALRYIYESIIQTDHWEKAIDKALDDLAQNKSEYVENNEFDALFSLVAQEDEDELPTG